MKKEAFCKKYNLSEKQFSGEKKIGGSLYLQSVTLLPDGFNPTVGGYLYLQSVTSLPDGFNPTVGGYLIFKNSRKHIGKTVKRPVVRINKNFFWEKNGKRYARIDGIFCELLNERENIMNGETYRILSAKGVNRENYFYIVNKGDFYSHASDLKKAFQDLEFKISAEKMKNEPLKKDTMINVQHYRIITGACEMGCKNWMQQNKITKEEIRADELLLLLEKTNAYGLESFKKLAAF